MGLLRRAKYYDLRINGQEGKEHAYLQVRGSTARVVGYVPKRLGDQRQIQFTRIGRRALDGILRRVGIKPDF